MTVKLTLSGDKELLATLDKLPVAVGGKVMKNAIRAGGRPIVKAARAHAPEGPTGNLKKNIVAKLKVYKQSETAVLVMGGKWPKGAHAHLVEFGHGGPAPAPPHPFMRPAFDANTGTAMAKIEKSFRTGIKRETKKLAR